MNKVLLFILAVFVFTSCSPYIAFVELRHKKFPAFPDSEQIYIFSGNQEIPEEANYVGNLEIAAFEGKEFYPQGQLLIDEIEKKMRSKGANLLVLDEKFFEKILVRSIKGRMFRIPSFERKFFNLEDIKAAVLKDSSDKFVGIYEQILEEAGSIDSDVYLTYACIPNQEGGYKFLYISGYEQIEHTFFVWDFKRFWNIGDLKGKFKKTPNLNLFRTDFLSPLKDKAESEVAQFENGYIKMFDSKSVILYRKVFPEKAKYEELIGTLSGFAVNDNTIMTCYHGVKKHKNKNKDIRIFIKGINGDFSKKYEAVLDKFDEDNDFATLKLKDPTIKLEGNFINFDDEELKIGSPVYVLGYPLSPILGTNIKLSSGIISSNSGFVGDITNYQISVETQLGSSGSPALNKNGFLVGLVNSKSTIANNISYVSKVKYLKEFLKKNNISTSFIKNHDIADMEISEQISNLKTSIYIIESINIKESNKERKALFEKELSKEKEDLPEDEEE